MVESLLGRLPTDHLKVHSVVIGMAARAIFVGIIPLHHHGMKTQLLCESFVDLRVALQALEPAAQEAEFMAGRALAYAGDGLVRFGKGPWRNLATRCARSEQDQAQGRQARKENSPLAREHLWTARFIYLFDGRTESESTSSPSSFAGEAAHPGRPWQRHIPVPRSFQLRGPIRSETVRL